MEQTVSRSDLRSTSNTPEPAIDPDVFARLKQQSHLTFIRLEDSTVVAEANEQNLDDDQLDFQLFASSKSAGAPANKIVLRSPTPTAGDSGFVTPARGLAYYIAGNPSAQDALNIEAATITGDQVLANSRASWPGTSCPWKVLELPPSSLSHAARIQNLLYSTDSLRKDAAQGKRTRPGKKYRIKLRTKLAASRNAAETKDVAEREKRIRRNREKKLKKREKEKAKKVAEGDAKLAGMGGGGLEVVRD